MIRAREASVDNNRSVAATRYYSLCKRIFTGHFRYRQVGNINTLIDPLWHENRAEKICDMAMMMTAENIFPDKLMEVNDRRIMDR